MYHKTISKEKQPAQIISSTDATHIAFVQDYMQQHLHVHMTIQNLSKMACMSESKFKYSFKASLGSPVYHYLTQLRMERAKALLRESDLSIAQVAEAVSYKKPGAFASVFKKHTGQLPRDFRKTAQNK